MLRGAGCEARIFSSGVGSNSALFSHHRVLLRRQIAYEDNCRQNFKMDFELRNWAILLFILCELTYNFLYRDHIGFKYIRDRKDRADDKFPFFGPFGLSLMLFPIFFILSLVYPNKLVGMIYPLERGTMGLGFAIAVIGIAIIAKSKHQLGRNYSPCFDSFLPFDINAKGMYASIRHPIYLGNILRLIGLGIVAGSTIIWAIGAVMTFYFNRSARLEEEMLSKKFPEYGDYMKKTSRFLPGIF